jgi:hypothetical protein
MVLIGTQFPPWRLIGINPASTRLDILSGKLVAKHFEFVTQINEGDFQNFIYEIIIPIQLLKGSFEHFQLEIKIHAHWTIDISPAWIATSAYCPLAPGASRGPRKSTLFLVTNVQSPSMKTFFNSQSFHPRFPIQAT